MSMNYRNLSIRYKLMILLVLVGTLPALMIGYVFSVKEGELRDDYSKQLAQSSKTLGEIIDRNLFERYGDVQAFGFNTAAYDAANWKNPVEGNPLIVAMNNYTRAYGMYPLMMMLNPEGDVVATNSIAIDGKPIPVDFLYGENFKDQPWFKNALEGKFSEGRNGFTGTFVGEPMQNPLLKKIYGSDGYSISFSAPVKNSAGQMVGVWVNFFDMGIVDAIVGENFKAIEAGGVAAPDVMILDRTGTILVDYEPQALDASSKLMHDFSNLLVKNFVTNKETYIGAAELAMNGGTGHWTGRSPDSGETTLFGYSHTDGAYDYAGLGWSVLIGVNPDHAFAILDATRKSMNIAKAVAVLASLLLGWIVGLFA